MRNTNVENAVNRILDELDKLIRGEPVATYPKQELRAVIDKLEQKSSSVRLASVYFLSYALTDSGWSVEDVPIGTRGKYGDKRLGAELTKRNVTFHSNVTAFGENLGTKGNVRNFNLKTDPRFTEFVNAIATLTTKEKETLLKYAAWRMFDSRRVPKPLPPLPANYLTYARTLALCERLLAEPSEGHIQQFLVSAFLAVHRRRYGHDIVTHHPHASDTFDNTTGDVEEFRSGDLIAAYEVTVRGDWKNRLPDFQKKVVKGNLKKYVIIASNVRNSPELYPASALVAFVADTPYDLAIVDIEDFFTVFCAELTSKELVDALNQAYEYLLAPKLCGRQEFIAAYSAITQEWIDSK